MKKTLGVMLLATLMAGCSSTTPMNKDTTLGDLLGIGPISMPAGYGQAATTKPAQGVTSQSLITDCKGYYLTIQGTINRYTPKTKQEKLTKLASGNHLASVYISNLRHNGNPETWDQVVCEYDKNGKMQDARINYHSEK